MAQLKIYFEPLELTNPQKISEVWRIDIITTDIILLYLLMVFKQLITMDDLVNQVK